MKQNKIISKGAILAELLLAIAVIVLMIGFGTQLVNVSLTASKTSREREGALRLAQEALEAMRAIGYGNNDQSQGWNRIYLPPQGLGDAANSKGSSNPYYPIVSTSTPAMWILFTGAETITLEGDSYTRKVFIDNLSRDATGNIEATYNAANDDPGTQKITVTVSKTGASDTTIVNYLTRFFNDSGPQSDWSGGANCGPVAATSSPNTACSTTNMTTSNPTGSFKLQ